MGRIEQVQWSTALVTSTLLTTTQAQIVNITGMAVPHRVRMAWVLGMAKITSGLNTTALQLQLFMMPPAAGVTVGEVNNMTLVAAAGSTQQVLVMGRIQLPFASLVRFELDAKQISATGNGTVQSAGLLAVLF